MDVRLVAQTIEMRDSGGTTKTARTTCANKSLNPGLTPNWKVGAMKHSIPPIPIGHPLVAR